MDEFVWPCDKRIAHGPHSGTKVLNDMPDGSARVAPFYCPGVRAHPNTMIGRPGDGDS